MSYGEEVVLSEDVSLDLDSIDEYDNIVISDPDPESVSQIWDGEKQNVLALSVLLCLTLVTNFSALPVILFRRTRFGNGQFACLILCLNITDIITSASGLIGGLVLEVGDMTWSGNSQGCAAYYFISSWVVGLSNYLVVCLVCLLLVKRAPGVLARLQECKLLLLSLILISLLPATPELAIRTTVHLTPSQAVCILTTSPLTYALYVTFKLTLRHILPAILILLCILRPRTVVAKRISLILMGPPAVCECGPSGSVLSTPHECPKMARYYFHCFFLLLPYIKNDKNHVV